MEGLLFTHREEGVAGAEAKRRGLSPSHEALVYSGQQLAEVELG